MRRFIVVLTLALFACGDVQPGSQALAPASPSPTTVPSSTPLPSGVVDPQPLVQRVRGMIGVVLRIDDIATKLLPSADYLGNSIVLSPAANAPGTVWVVAVLGELAPSSGAIAIPNYSCGLFAFRADTGEIWSSGGGSLSKCQPYFARSLTPPDATVRCATDTYDNGLPRDNRFSRTSPGPFTIAPMRDDAWHQPTIVRGAFLAQAPEGSIPYLQAFCVNAFIRQPTVEKLLMSGVAATLPQTPPSLEWAIWLRGYHAVAGSADAAGHIDVVVEPRAGYEWAFFDWHALVPEGGYVMFRFVDHSGRELIPWRLANGP